MHFDYGDRTSRQIHQRSEFSIDLYVRRYRIDLYFKLYLDTQAHIFNIQHSINIQIRTKSSKKTTIDENTMIFMRPLHTLPSIRMVTDVRFAAPKTMRKITAHTNQCMGSAQWIPYKRSLVPSEVKLYCSFRRLDQRRCAVSA